jgi:diacylglycerol O-acyltransferase / wax synthase
MAGLERLPDRELGGMEALFVKGDSEVATRSTVNSLFVLAREPDFDDVRLAHDRASRLVPRFRQRVVAPVVPISRPYWIVDPDFDLSYHVRQAKLPLGGGIRQLYDFSTQLGQVPLDPARPLWEVILITGLDDGAAALLYKFHHSISDGTGGPRLFAEIFGERPGEFHTELPPMPAVEDVTATELTRHRLGQLPFQLAEAAVGVVGDVVGISKRAARSPRSSLHGVAGYVGSLRRIMLEEAVEPSPLLARRGLRRHWGSVRGPLDDLRAAAKDLECSLNDLYLAALCGGLGRYHEEQGQSVDEIPLALPVSIRRPEDPPDSNRFVGVRIAAPIGASGIRERAQLIGERVRQARTEPALTAFSALAPAASLMPMWMISAAAPRPSDIQASNIPSWPMRRYLGTTQVTATTNFGPTAMSAMMSVLVSYGGSFDIGLNIDSTAVSDPAALVGFIGDEFSRLIAPATVEVVR